MHRNSGKKNKLLHLYFDDILVVGKYFLKIRTFLLPPARPIFWGKTDANKTIN